MPREADTAEAAAARRAGQLLRWYPPAWRSRYGAEFTELLISDICERPRSRTRTLDVVRGGISARFAAAGLGGCAFGPVERVRASLVSLACSMAVFLAFGAAMWSQLIVGWQWSAPDNSATTVATVMMSAAMLAFLVLAVAAAVPVLWGVVSGILRGRQWSLMAPSLLFLAGAVVIFAGGRHFGNGWPGTGGHPWIRQGLVPGGVAAFSWASTLSISTFWVHPSVLATLPAAELAWMALSPLAIACVVYGTATAVRRTGFSPRVLRYEARLGAVACAAMVVFLSACLAWIVDGGPGPRNLFHAGTIDVAGVVVLTIALAVAQRAAREARRGGLRLTAR